MYRYDEFDAHFVAERVEQFRYQVERRLSGELTEDEFKPLRLMNGLYLQLHAYMLRIAVPYGTLSARQLRMLAHIARKYDKGYGHFTTRQNMQFNWITLVDVPDILAELASVEMHCMQTSGNCIRNVTADHFAGAAADEIEDPRPLAEIIRQWSTLHPEFSFLPRKFKIAVGGAAHDRAALQIPRHGGRDREERCGRDRLSRVCGRRHGAHALCRAGGRRVRARRADILAFLEAVMRVYNEAGRRDNIYKARVKILVERARASRRCAAASRANSPRSGRPARLQLPQEELDAHRGLFRAAGIRDAAGRARRIRTARDNDRISPTGLQHQCHAAPQRPAMPSPRSR